VRAACSLQRSILAEDWPPELEPRVRMGIHTGDYDASDHLGLVVNQAARVRATAHGGQIVTSHVVAILAQDLGDIRLRPLGSYRVRDFAEPELLHQVEAPGLPSAFPALETLENAVPPVTAITSLDLCGASARVSVPGPGGIGEAQGRFMRYLRDRFEVGGGRFIKLVGDGCMALFDSPVAAVGFIREVAAGSGSSGYEIQGDAL
jgi:class 3 adenylate cyclase